MLCLTRKTGQAITIGDDETEIVVSSVRDGVVRFAAVGVCGAHSYVGVADDTFSLGADVTLVITGVQGRAVTFGIDAPRHVPVDRREIYEAKRRRPDFDFAPVVLAPMLAVAGGTP